MHPFFRWLDKEYEKPDEKVASNNAEYQAYKKIWEAAEPATPPTVPDTTAAWHSLRQKMREADAEVVVRPWYAFLRPAHGMAFAMVLLLSFLGWNVYLDKVPVVYTTERGQTLTITLPDNSTVDLNAESRLSHSRRFARGNRDLDLSGEAWFAVEKGETPFVIRTGVASVTVLGTMFNVFARDQRVEVAVTEGRVSVAAEGADPAKEVILQKGQFTACVAGSLPDPARLLRLDHHPSWRDGELIFEKASLDRICREIERRYDVTIQLSDTSLAEQEVTGLFQGDNAEELIATLCTMLGREYVSQDRTFIIE